MFNFGYCVRQGSKKAFGAFLKPYKRLPKYEA